MANTATIKVLVDDKALQNLTDKAASTAKLIRGGFDIATGAASVFGDQSAQAMEKLANKAIIVSQTFDGIDDLLTAMGKSEGFLKLAQKIGVTKNGLDKFSKALPFIGVGIVALTAAWDIYQAYQDRVAERARAKLVGIAENVKLTLNSLSRESSDLQAQLGKIDTLPAAEKNIKQTKDKLVDLQDAIKQAGADLQKDFIKYENAPNLNLSLFLGDAGDNEEIIKKRQEQINKYTKYVNQQEKLASSNSDKRRVEDLKANLNALIAVQDIQTKIFEQRNKVEEAQDKKTEIVEKKKEQAAQAVDKKAREREARREKERQQALAKADLSLRKSLAQEGLTQEEITRLTLENFDKKIAIQEKYGKSSEEFVVGRLEFVKQREDQAAKDFVERTKQEYDNAQKLSANYYDRLILQAQKNGEDTSELELKRLENQLQIAKDYGQDTIQIELQIQAKKKEIRDKEVANAANTVQEIVENETLTREQGIAELQKLLDKKLITEKQFAKAVEEINKNAKDKELKALDERVAKLQAVSKLVQDVGALTRQFFENAIEDISRQNEKQLKELDEAEQAALQRAGDNAQARESIEAQFQQKRVQINEEAEQKIKEQRKKQALADIAFTLATLALDTASALIKAETNFERGIIIASSIVAATAAVAAKAQVLKLQRGGILSGPSHSAGGIYMGGGVEAEGGEAVINRRSTMAFGGMLSAINEAGGGAPLLNNTGVGTSSATQANSIIDYGKLAAAIGAVPTRAYVVTQDISLAQDKQTAIKSKATIA